MREYRLSVISFRLRSVSLRVRWAALLVVVALLGACRTPPVMLEAGRPSLDRVWAGMPKAAERVEVSVDDDTLVGIYVAPEPGCPVVLHLLSSKMSVSTGMHCVVRQLHDLGIGSLMIDYRGIGASTGERGPQHLRPDAAAMFDALRRRTAAPVLVRASSIGGLALATLLDAGRDIAGFTLHAPVLDETVFRRAVAEVTVLGAFVLNPFYRRPTGVDLFATLGRATGSRWVSMSEADFFLTDRERERIAEIVGSKHVRRFGALTHESHAAGTRTLLPGELEFFLGQLPAEEVEARWQRTIASLDTDTRARVVGDESARRRLRVLTASSPSVVAPRILAALALARCEVENARHWLEVLRVHPEFTLDRLAFEDLVTLLSMDDSGGELPAWCLLALAWRGALEDWSFDDVLERHRRDHGLWADLRDRVRRSAFVAAAGRYDLELEGGLTMLVPRGPTGADPGDRRWLRLLLKAARVPERVDPDSGRLEVRIDDVWRAIDPSRRSWP